MAKMSLHLTNNAGQITHRTIRIPVQTYREEYQKAVYKSNVGCNNGTVQCFRMLLTRKIVHQLTWLQTKLYYAHLHTRQPQKNNWPSVTTIAAKLVITIIVVIDIGGRLRSNSKHKTVFVDGSFSMKSSNMHCVYGDASFC